MNLRNSCLLPLALLLSTSQVVEAAPAAQAAPATEAARGTASGVLARVQAFYDGTQDMEAGFQQTYTNRVYGQRTVSKGALKIMKPGRMVWDYEAESDPDFYVDGDRLWVIENDTRQVVSQTVKGNANLAGATKFLFGGQKLIKTFKVRLVANKLIQRYGQAGHTVIEIKPKQKNPHYKSMLLVVDDATGRVDAFVVRNQDNSINHFELSKVTLNVGLKAATFKYTVPKGYVETRQ
jgi:outer membrane lipoprotein carrier protein